MKSAYIKTGSNTIIYRFPLESLEMASHKLYGLSLDEQSQRTWFSKEKPPSVSRIDWKDSGNYEHLRTYLVFLHESFHLKNINASPLGLLLWLLYSTCFVKSTELLKEWGEKIKHHDTIIHLPLIGNHRNDSYINKLDSIRIVNNFGNTLFYFSYEFARMISREMLWLMNDEIKTISMNFLGTAYDYPNIVLKFEDELYSSDSFKISGNAVVEGLARCNEYIALIAHFQVPIEVLNRFLFEKGHGEYQAANSHIQKILGIGCPDYFILTATIADWALQAPVLPFLLIDRDIIALEELIPSSRFCLLANRFKKLGFEIKDLTKRPKEVEDALFNELGWESPSKIAERILNTTFLVPKSSLIQQAIQSIIIGATIRQDSDFTLRMPFSIFETNLICSSIAFFSDAKALALGKLSRKEIIFYEILKYSLDTSIIDSLCDENTMDEPIFICNTVEKELNMIEYRNLLFQKLEQLIGPRGAMQILSK